MQSVHTNSQVFKKRGELSLTNSKATEVGNDVQSPSFYSYFLPSIKGGAARLYGTIITTMSLVTQSAASDIPDGRDYNKVIDDVARKLCRGAAIASKAEPVSYCHFMFEGIKDLLFQSNKTLEELLEMEKKLDISANDWTVGSMFGFIAKICIPCVIITVGAGKYYLKINDEHGVRFGAFTGAAVSAGLTALLMTTSPAPVIATALVGSLFGAFTGGEVSLAALNVLVPIVGRFYPRFIRR